MLCENATGLQIPRHHGNFAAHGKKRKAQTAGEPARLVVVAVVLDPAFRIVPRQEHEERARARA